MIKNKKIENIQSLVGKESLYTISYGSEFKRQIVFFHDIGEYHDRYKDFANFLFSNKVGITFIDMRGHGLSSGTRGHASCADEILSDYEAFLQKKSNRYKGKDVIFCGHGVGALIAMNLSRDFKNVKGLILVNPTIRFKIFGDFTIEKYLGEKSIFDKLRLSLSLRGESISSERDVIRNYTHDPLVNKKMTIGMYKSLRELFDRVKYVSYFINIPVFYLMGMEDEIVDLDISELFSGSIDRNHIYLKKYQSLGHELFNEIDRDKAFQDIYNWVNVNLVSDL